MLTAITTPNASAISSAVAPCLHAAWTCRDAAVALACDTNHQRNQFARLCVEPSGLGAGVTQLAIAPHGLRAQLPEIADCVQQLLAVLIPIEHHRPPLFLSALA